jgi:hypothetical protein
MGKVEITLKSSLVTKLPRKDRKPTIYSRSIRKLSEDKRHPGKILRVYVHIDGDYKTFGAFTINTGGSISFFPDFYKLDNFDHLTISKDFIKDKGHLSKIESEGKHKKAYFFEANKLPTNDYHLITFMMKDGDLLMDCLPEIHYPNIEFENDAEESFLKLLEEAIHTDAYMLDFPEEKGFYCIQIQIIPKGKDINKVSIWTSIIEDFLLLPKPLEKIVSAKKVEVTTPPEFDFTLGIIMFKVNQELRSPFAFAMAQDKNHPIH